MDRQRVDTAGQFAGQRSIDHAVALDPGLSAEDIRHNINPEMRLAAGTMPGMSLMAVRFIDHLEVFGGESFGQFLCDELLNGHAGALDHFPFLWNREMKGSPDGDVVDEAASTQVKSDPGRTCTLPGARKTKPGSRAALAAEAVTPA